MSLYVDTIEQFQKEAPEAYALLAAAMGANKYYKDDADDLEMVVEFVKDYCNRSEETIDSCDITNTYYKIIEGYRFEVFGTSYRKDQSVCDQEMDQSIEIHDIEAEKAVIVEADNSNRLYNRNHWSDFLTMDLLLPENRELLLNKLEKVEYVK